MAKGADILLWRVHQANIRPQAEAAAARAASVAPIPRPQGRRAQALVRIVQVGPTVAARHQHVRIVHVSCLYVALSNLYF